MWLTVSEFVNCPKFPNTVRGCRITLDKLAKENPDIRRKKQGTKAFEYNINAFPEELKIVVKTYIAKKFLNKSENVSLSNIDTSNLQNLTEEQRNIADARMAIIAYVQQLEQLQPRYKAIKYFCNQAKNNSLPEHVQSLIKVANARNKNGKSERTLSERTLNQWVLDYEKCKTPAERLQRLAPLQRREKELNELTWLPHFLAVYRNTNGVNIAEAYTQYISQAAEHYADQPYMLEILPSLSAVRRGLKKLNPYMRAIGRKTGAELRALNTYVKRDWSVLRANDVWVGDGHSMKMKVAHPDHGRPFIPELTLVMDAASRFIVGWSVSLAENCLAVADAIRNGVENHGIPAIYYSDNGGGEKNWMLDHPITGILPRLGINHQTGIPGNPQGRGIIERVNQTLALRIARQFATYHGTGADRETVRKTSTAVISLDKALRDGRTELTDKQQWAKGKLPTWQQFIDAVQIGVDWYNNEHIHREIGMTPARKRQQLLNNDDIIRVTPIEARDMFRPQVLRVAQRGWVSLFNNDYFSQKLLDVDGEKVVVAFDIHDANSVIIRKQDGTYLCDAVWNGNKRAAFAEAFVDKARQARHQRRMKLKQEQVDEINAELNPVISIEHKESADWLHQIRVKGSSEWEEVEEIAVFPSEMKRQQQKIKAG